MTALIIGIFVMVVLVGVPAYFCAKVWKNAEKESELPSSDVISKSLKKAFHIMFWGIDMVLGSWVIMITSSIWAGLSNEYGMLDRLPIALTVTLIPMLIGFILLIVGRIKLGTQTRVLEHGTGRKLTPLEQYTLIVMNGIEGENIKTLSIQVAKVTNNKVDDVLAATTSVNILFRMAKLGRLHTGDNYIKNHWSLILVLAVALFFVVLIII